MTQVALCAVTSTGSVQASAQGLPCKRRRGRRLEHKYKVVMTLSPIPTPIPPDNDLSP